MAVHRMRRLLEWGSKARKEEARLRGRGNEERAQLADQLDDEPLFPGRLDRGLGASPAALPVTPLSETEAAEHLLP
jgi:hypothetical protein